MGGLCSGKKATTVQEPEGKGSKQDQKKQTQKVQEIKKITSVPNSKSMSMIGSGEVLFLFVGIFT